MLKITADDFPLRCGTSILIGIYANQNAKHFDLRGGRYEGINSILLAKCFNPVMSYDEYSSHSQENGILHLFSSASFP